jgi:hypothetical protein
MEKSCDKECYVDAFHSDLSQQMSLTLLYFIFQVINTLNSIKNHRPTKFF